MTESQNNKAENIEVTSAATEVPRHSVYLYESAGIAERQGKVPVWLWMVAAGLLIWGVYYLITYWNE